MMVPSDVAPLAIIKPVPAPESVGEEAAAMKSPSSGILSFNLSLTNLKTELKNIRYYYSIILGFFVALDITQIVCYCKLHHAIRIKDADQIAFLAIL